MVLHLLIQKFSVSQLTSSGSKKCLVSINVDRILDEVDQISARMSHRFREMGGQQIEQFAPEGMLLGLGVLAGLGGGKLEQLGRQHLVLEVEKISLNLS